MELKKNKILLQLIGVGVIVTFIFSVFQDKYVDAFKRGYEVGYQDASENGNRTYEVKLLLTPHTESDRPQVLTLANGEEVRLQHTEGTYIVYSGIDLERFPYYWYIVFLVSFIIAVLLLVSFVRFIRNLVRGDVLTHSTQRALVYLGLSLISFSVLDYVYCYIQWNEFRKLFAGTGFTVRQDFAFDFSWLMGGLIFLAISIGIKVALRIKAENELTV